MCLVQNCARRLRFLRMYPPVAERADPGGFSRDRSAAIFLGEPAPEFVEFADPVSARVLGAAIREGKYRTRPSGQDLFCPGVAGSGNKGYVLSVHVYQVMGDTAFATLTWDCNPSPPCPSGQLCGSMGIVRHMTNYLLVRTKGTWEIVRIVNGAVLTST